MGKNTPGMPYRYVGPCRRCSATDRKLSRRGNCDSCQIELQTYAAVELHQHAGPTWDAWLAAITAAIGDLAGDS